MPITLKRLKKVWKYGSARTGLAAVCAHSVSISIGVCQGYSAILIPQLMKSQEFAVDAVQSSWLASLGAVTNPVGSILSGLLAEWCGRKIAIQTSSIPLIIGWLLIAFANDINWLYAGRLITGIAAGMSTASYTYVSEISSAENRGIFQALGPVSASFGILFTYTLGAFVRWDTLALAALAFALMTVINMHFLPESPAFSMRQGRTKEAFNDLIWLRRSNALAQHEYQLYAKLLAQEKNAVQKTEYITSTTLKPFAILITLFFLQELSGIYAVLFYAINFFQDAEINLDENVTSIVIGSIRFAMSIVAAFLINKYARRRLCIISCAGMSLSLLTLIIYLNLATSSSILPLICILTNVLFSMIGLLPIPWILVGELFTLKVRSIMSGFVICIAQCFIFISVKVYPDLIKYLSFSGTLTVFCAAAFLALIFAIFCLPETKNKSLEEIEGYFKRKKIDVTPIGGIENGAYAQHFDNWVKHNHIFTIAITR